MNLEQIIPIIVLILVLILVLPNFVLLNFNLNIFFKNISIWAVIVLLVMVVLYIVNWMKKINLAITGCMGRMGQQIIKTIKSNKNFKIIALTESKEVKKKINGKDAV